MCELTLTAHIIRLNKREKMESDENRTETMDGRLYDVSGRKYAGVRRFGLTTPTGMSKGCMVKRWTGFQIGINQAEVKEKKLLNVICS